MPVKRRRTKRRADPVAEADAWADYFATGFDLGGEAAALTGLVEGRGDARDVWEAAARDAWRRVGRIFLDRMADDFNGPADALERWGEPESCQ